LKQYRKRLKLLSKVSPLDLSGNTQNVRRNEVNNVRSPKSVRRCLVHS